MPAQSINKTEQERKRALAQQKKQDWQMGGLNQPEQGIDSEEEDGNIEGPPSLKESQRKLAQEQKQAMGQINFSGQNPMSQEGGLSGQLQGAGSQLGQKGTAKALGACWKAIYYVFPLIYIDIHFIGHYLPPHPWFKELFCRFGTEWTAGGGEMGGMGAGAMESAKSESVSKKIEYIEIAAMVFCNLIVGLAVLIIITYINLIAHVITDIFSGNLKEMWQSMKWLYDLFGIINPFK